MSKKTLVCTYPEIYCPVMRLSQKDDVAFKNKDLTTRSGAILHRLEENFMVIVLLNVS